MRNEKFSQADETEFLSLKTRFLSYFHYRTRVYLALLARRKVSPFPPPHVSVQTARLHMGLHFHYPLAGVQCGIPDSI
jgi:hypothetical protein